jgi:GNAT superfamily N-acetyltransferase
MPDLLVRLYDLPDAPSAEKLHAAGVSIRRALPPERGIVLDWIRKHFDAMWASEAAVALSGHPVTTWVAVADGEMLGFACHDATAKGFFGPTGVSEAARGKGIGEALLFATLNGMREAGYAYAVIGDPGPIAFYQKRLDALIIPDSSPGLYRGMLKPQER